MLTIAIDAVVLLLEVSFLTSSTYVLFFALENSFVLIYIIEFFLKVSLTKTG